MSELKRKNSDLKEAEIEGILHILNSHDSLSNNELIRLTGIPKNILKVFKSSFAAYLYDDDTDTIQLNSKGKQLLQKENPRPYKWTLLNFAEPGLLDLSQRFRQDYEQLSKREFDQFYATPQSSVSKAMLLDEKGIIEEKSIALIGDDDLVSLLLFNLNARPILVSVFEIDPALIGYINGVKNTNLVKYQNLNVVCYDARKVFDRQNIRRYDAVLIDPPYTVSGIKLFLYRSLQLLKGFDTFEGKYIFLNFGAGLRNPEKETKIQSIINAAGLVIEDKINKYTSYTGAETIGSSSSIYVLKTTPFTNASDQVLNNKIYTYEKTELEKFPYVDHIVIKVQDVPQKIITSKTALQLAFGRFCNKHSLKVVDTKITKFKKQGYSFTYILANSNLTIHTWPELNALHIVLVTCSPVHNKERLGQNISKLLNTSNLEVNFVE
ncbi:MAG: bis-aminopropyl spermidine synthase family protein [Paludibacteraceae bacterium]|nr:bis-aminopropyl spermidine synthase family protein [Paludibacteraceae bacterium]